MRKKRHYYRCLGTIGCVNIIIHGIVLPSNFGCPIAAAVYLACITPSTYYTAEFVYSGLDGEAGYRANSGYSFSIPFSCLLSTCGLRPIHCFLHVSACGSVEPRQNLNLFQHSLLTSNLGVVTRLGIFSYYARG